MTELFDTHCHYSLEPIWPRYQDFWQEAQADGVKKTIVVSPDLEQSLKVVDLVKTEKNWWAGIGIHPTDFLERDNHFFQTEQLTNTQWEQLKANYEKELAIIEDLLKHDQADKIVAVGEAGLEYFRLSQRPDFTRIRAGQNWLLEEQIALAIKYKKTLVLHLRDENQSEEVANDILYQLKQMPNNQRVILHCVGGTSKKVVVERDKLPNAANIFVSFAGNVTFKNAQEIRDLIQLTPPQQLLIETDAPFLTPEPERGHWPCHPAQLVLTANYLVENFGIDLNQVWQNSHRAFGLA